MERFNKSIAAVSLDTPSGCMGECPWFTMRVRVDGAFEYRGIANMPKLGAHKGSVNFIAFDYIANVIETSGFLQLPPDDYSKGFSTGGYTTITVEKNDGSSITFARDFVNPAPLIWAVERLMTQLLERAEWGDDAYAQAIAGPQPIDPSPSLVNGRVDFQRRELPESELKRFLKTHRVMLESVEDNSWIVYRFGDGSTVHFLKDSEEYLLVAANSQTTFENFTMFAEYLGANVGLWKT